MVDNNLSEKKKNKSLVYTQKKKKKIKMKSVLIKTYKIFFFLKRCLCYTGRTMVQLMIAKYMRIYIDKYN